MHSIADIGKERIRRVVAKMQKESAGKLDLKDRDTPEDLGFQVFKLAPSNFKPWQSTTDKDAQAYTTQLSLLGDPLADGWKIENVIYEVAVKEGFGLNCRIEKIENAKPKSIYRVSDPDKEQSFYICLDEHVHLDALKPLELTREKIFICRDRALDDDAAANLALQCRLKTI